MYFLYECGNCGNTSKSYDEIIKCEANHLGITVEERVRYSHLKKDIEAYSIRVSKVDTDKTRGNLDRAIKALEDFEKEHNIEGNKTE